LQSFDAGIAARNQVEAKHVASKSAAAEDILVKVSEAVHQTMIASFNAPLTQVIKFTGPAMSPVLNRTGSAKASAYEFLLTHKIVHPSRRNVLKGDVVCFKHPSGGVKPGALMVRRVTAAGGDLLESTKDATVTHQLLDGTVWVSAENPDLEPPHVEDSRTFGPIQLTSIVGRCIYAIRSKADRQHISNNARWTALDKDIVEVELTEQLLDQLESDAA
jgi:hypothetical protein